MQRILLFSVVSAHILLMNSAIAEAGQRFKLGVVVALTGAMSVHGEVIKNSILLAKEQFDLNNTIDILIENDDWQPRNTVSAVQKLIDRDKVDALVVFGTNQGLSVVPLTEKAEIPLLSINVNRSVVRGKTRSFLMMPSVEALMSASVQRVRELGYKKMAVVATVQDSCLLQKQLFEASGVSQITKSMEILGTEQDLRDIASQLKKSGPSAIFLSTLIPQGAILAKRLRESGFQGAFFAGIQEASLTELKLSNGALMGAWVVAGDEAQADAFYASYKQRFGIDIREVSFFGIYGFDAFRLLLDGRRSGDLLTFLRTVKDFRGASGVFSADGENGFTFPVAVRTFSEKGFR